MFKMTSGFSFSSLSLFNLRGGMWWSSTSSSSAPKDMNSTCRFRVVICGAGIAGLTAAVALSEFPDIDVEIYEAASQLAEIGVGIGIFPRPWRVIQVLGLEEEMSKYSEVKRREGPVPGFRYRKGDQTTGLEFYTLVTNGNMMMFHRADFQRVLLGRLPKSYKIHTSKRLRSYTQCASGPIEVFFEDGSTTTCDVLIGADGIKSAARRSLLTEKAEQARSKGKHDEADTLMARIEPTWSGLTCYRALISTDELKQSAPHHKIYTRPTQYLGKDTSIIAYPIGGGKLINFVAFTARHDLEHSPFDGPWVSPVDRSEFAPFFDKWETEAHQLIACVHKTLRWAVHQVQPLDTYVSGGVALVGDASHAMSPFQGSGAGQGIEDAYILATVLGHPSTTRDNIHRALKVFDDIRRPEAHLVAEKARRHGQIYTFYQENLDGLSPDDLMVKLESISEELTRIWEWTWTTSVEDSRDKALRLLESRS